MTKIANAFSAAHRGTILFFSLATVPVLLAFFLIDLFSGANSLMERLAPSWEWLVNMWFLSAAYFCVSLVLSPAFRESLLTKISGFRERDEREEIVTAKAARSVFLVILGCSIAGGLMGMVRLNVFSYTRWQGDQVPPLVKVGPYHLRHGVVAKHAFIMWPGIGVPREQPAPEITERTDGNAQYYYEGGPMFPPEVSRTFFALAALQVLLFHLFARRVRA